MKINLQTLIFTIFLTANSNNFAQNITLVKDINPSGSGYPNSLSVINNKLYFGANDGVNGSEWWTSDGTTAGTNLFIDVNPGSTYSGSSGFTLYNGNIYFSANYSTFGTDF